MKLRSKRYQELSKLVEHNKQYSILDASDLVLKTSNTKFKSSIDLVLKLNLDTTKAEQQLRGNIALPHYFGKKIKVLVLDDSITKEIAKENNIDYFGGTDQIAHIKEGWLDFDLIITIPKFMPLLAPLGKLLGPKGLMPNPKLGTVTPTPIKTVAEFKKGKYNYRTDTFGNIHMKIADTSATSQQIAENVIDFINFIKSKRPNTVKGEYFQKIVLHSTMGPAINIQLPK